jgi:hypothetical protein
LAWHVRNLVASYTHHELQIARGRALRRTIIALGESVVNVALNFNINAWEELREAAVISIPVHLWEAPNQRVESAWSGTARIWNLMSRLGIRAYGINGALIDHILTKWRHSFIRTGWW